MSKHKKSENEEVLSVLQKIADYMHSSIRVIEDLSKTRDKQLELAEKISNQNKILSNQNDALLKKIQSDEGNSLGLAVENLAADSLKPFMKKHFGIELVDVRRRWPTKRTEIDVAGLTKAEDIIVVVEAKTTITEEKINKFRGIVGDFVSKHMPEMRDKKVYGGIAYLGVPKKIKTQESIKELVKFAEDKGLFVMKVIDNNNYELMNSEEFELTEIEQKSPNK